MSIETAPFISSLNPAHPLNTDPLSEADDHLRLIKGATQASFPNINAAVTATPTQLNNVVTTFGGQSIAGTTTFGVVNAGTLGVTIGNVGTLAGTTGALSGAFSAGTLTSAGAVNGVTLSGSTLVSSGGVSAVGSVVGGTVTSSGTINGVTGNFSGTVLANSVSAALAVDGTTATFTGNVGGGLILQNGAALVPPGVIALWDGGILSIPAGWAFYSGSGAFPTYIQKT